MLVYPHINPIALQIGPLSIHWYGIMYLVGFAAAWFLARRRAAQPGSSWSAVEVDDFLFYAMLGVIIGGRVGYVIFYGLGNWHTDWLYPLNSWASRIDASVFRRIQCDIGCRPPRCQSGHLVFAVHIDAEDELRASKEYLTRSAFENSGVQ